MKIPWRVTLRYEVSASLIFGALSAAWIVVSDRVAEAIAPDVHALTRLQTFKGWLFVGLTTLLVYALLRYYRIRSRRTFDQLRESEQRLRDVVAHAADGILLTDPFGDILTANPAACTMLGYSEDEIRALGRGGVLSKNDPRLAAAMALRERTNAFDGVLEWRRADGSVFEGEVSSRLYTSATGKRRTTVMFRDSSEKLASERRLEQSEARYRALFEDHHVPTLMIDPEDARIVDANAAAARFYGWDREALRSMHIYDINLLGTTETLETIARVCQHGHSWFRFSHRTADGTLKPVDVYAGPIRIDGRTLLLSVVHDQTPLHQAQEALARRNRLFALLSGTNQALLRATDRDAFLQRVCELAVEPGGLMACWVGIVAPDGAIAMQASAGDMHGYLDALCALTVDESKPSGRGPTARAIRDERPVITNDFLAAAPGAPWEAAARAAGIASSGVFPIRERGRVVGALCLYSAEPGFFTPDDVSTLTDVAADISFGLDRLADQREHVRTTEELARAERRWRFALEGAGHGLWEWDLSSGRVEVSRALAAMVGLAVSEVPTTFDDWRAIVHPDDVGLMGELFKDFAEGREAVLNAEYRVRSADGEWKSVLCSGAIFERDDEGQPMRALGTQVDLTPVRKAEWARRELEALTLKVVEHSPDLVFINRDDRIAYINPAGLRLLEASSPDEVLGRPVFELFPPDRHARIRARIAALRAEPGRVSPPVEERLRTVRGRVVDVEASAVSYVEDGGTTIQVTCRDVSERLRAEHERRELSDRLHLALGASGQGIYDINVQSGDVIVSPEYAAMLGEDPATFRESATAWTERLHPDDRARMTAMYAAYVAGRIPEYRAEFRLRTASGEWIWVLSLGRVVEYDAAGEPLRMLGTHTDVTVRREAEAEIARLNADLLLYADDLERRVAERTAELVAANREIESFSYSVSHDLRAPLRAIDGFSAALERSQLELLDADGAHYVSRIRSSVHRMGRLIDDLLTLSRVTRAELAYEEIDLGAEAARIVGELRARAPGRCVRTVIAEGLRVRAAPRLVATLLENLIDNAWKFTSGREESAIEVGALAVSGGPTRYFVRDDGVGFDLAFAENLFTPFQRFHPETEFPGNGVGLAIVQRIVSRHSGSVWAESEPGRGTTIWFTLTASADSSEPPVPRPPRTSGGAHVA